LFAESQIQDSLGADSQQIEATVSRIKAIGVKIQDLVVQTARSSTKCIISLECIAGLGSTVVSLLADINEEVTTEVANLQSFKLNVLPGVANTVAALVGSALSQAADIAHDTVTCLKNAAATAQ
jgi:hypothetical protein